MLRGHDVTTQLDFLSIDIDGLDYDVMGRLGTKPRVICVEVNAGHSPTATALIPSSIAEGNVGQPLQAFVDLGGQLGYRLVCYTANAFFIRNDVGGHAVLPTLSAEDAYGQFLQRVGQTTKRYLTLVNKGAVPPYFKFKNPYLTAEHLELGVAQSVIAMAEQMLWRTWRRLPRTVKDSIRGWRSSRSP